MTTWRPVQSSVKKSEGRRARKRSEGTSLNSHVRKGVGSEVIA